ncbi:hypothetical protein [Proteiniphilum sp. UBA5384]|uniref:hypothetical protein n=1 Tax=Proteiniphilum sp. UBA5384 TaxID=1947279 RepID=UPI0025F52D7F|nr:hypothetical protein [Proteiniphilum sp. UBA5384]
MKTKNFLLIAAFIICGLVCVNSVNGQTPPTQTADEVTVNIRFKQIQSIVVNPAEEHQTVNLDYFTLQNYQEGVSVTKNDHLTVFSSGGFQVKVKAESPAFTRMGGSETIQLSDMVIQASNGSGNDKTYGDGGLPLVNLSTGEQSLIGSSTGGGNLNFNITYDNTVAGNEFKYINNHVRPEETSVYTATVTYSIVAI